MSEQLVLVEEFIDDLPGTSNKVCTVQTCGLLILTTGQAL